MDTSDNRSFSCTCGKKYKWKPEFAGKRVKCACGAAVNVPAAMGSTPAASIAKNEPKPAPVIAKKPALEPAPVVKKVPAPSLQDDPYDTSGNDFDLGEGIAPPPQAPRSAAAAALASGVPAMPSRSLQYRGAADASDVKASRNLTDPARDIYVPTALLVIGFLTFVVWVLFRPRTFPYELPLVALFVGTATAIKTAVILGLALLLAPMIGISFGLLRTAILKFAAIIVFSDAVLLWVEMIQRAAGGISHNNTTVIHFFVVMIGVTAMTITASSYYLFNMDVEDIATFAVPMALISWFIGFLFNLAIVALLTAILAGAAAARNRAAAVAAAPPPARTQTVARSNTAAAPGAGAAASAETDADTTAADKPPVDMTPVTIVPTVQDKMIAAITSRPARGPIMWTGPIWNQKKSTTDGRTSQLITQMTDAGAVQTWIEMKPNVHGASEAMIAGTMFVELPAQKGARQACYDVAGAYLKEKSQPAMPSTQPGSEQYLVVKLSH